MSVGHSGLLRLVVDRRSALIVAEMTLSVLVDRCHVPHPSQGLKHCCQSSLHGRLSHYCSKHCSGCRCIPQSHTL